MITILVVIVSLILFVLFTYFVFAGIANDEPTLAFGGIILTVLLCFGMAAYICSDTLTEPETTKTTEVEQII